MLSALLSCGSGEDLRELMRLPMTQVGQEVELRVDGPIIALNPHPTLHRPSRFSHGQSDQSDDSHTMDEDGRLTPMDSTALMTKRPRRSCEKQSFILTDQPTP
jgi:hypothetical protein